MKALVEACQKIGACVPAWTQGQGGNVSVKEDGSLWIKASGMRLDEVSTAHGLAKLPLEEFLSRLALLAPSDDQSELKYAELLGTLSVKDPGLGRASMETGFHALLPDQWVMHFHSLAALLMCDEYRRSPAKMQDWLDQQEADAIFVPPWRPGLDLSRRLGSDPGHEIYLLENHGVVLQGSTQEVLARWQALERQYCADRSLTSLLKLLDRCDRTELAAQASGLISPMRIYFPDTAVFLDRLRSLLEPAQDRGDMLFKLQSGAAARDPNMAELWLATGIIHELCPTMANLPDEIASTLAGLPTEQFRRNLEKSKE